MRSSNAEPPRRPLVLFAAFQQEQTVHHPNLPLPGVVSFVKFIVSKWLAYLSGCFLTEVVLLK